MLADRRIRKNLPVFIGLSVLLLFVFGYLYTSSFESSPIGSSIDEQSQSENDDKLEDSQNPEDLPGQPGDEILSKDPRIRQRNREDNESFYDEKLRQKHEEDRLAGNGNADVVEEDIDPLNVANKSSRNWNSTLVSQNVVGNSEAAKTWFRSRLPSRRYQKLLGDVESNPKDHGQPEHLELSEKNVLRRSKRYETLLTR